MYQLGDLIMYGIHGVCRLVDRENRVVDKKEAQYLVLEPLGQNASRFYVPANNPNAMAKLRPVLNRQELEEILRSDAVRKENWIETENLRKQYYRELITGGDRVALLQMVRTLHLHKKAQAEAKRKFHLCDENFLRDAQRLIETEFAVVLGIPENEVQDYILDRMNA